MFQSNARPALRGRSRISMFAAATCAAALSLSTSACASDPGDSGSGSAGSGDPVTRDAKNVPAPATPSAGRPRLVRVATTGEAVEIKSAPGYRKLMFVVNRDGRVMVLKNGRILRRPFLDISNRVQSGGSEQGLLSIAFPSDYKKTGRFYVYYNRMNGDVTVDEYRRSTAVRAKRSSRRHVISIPHRFAENHNGGTLNFYKDDLFFGTGDGGGAGDTRGNAQDLGSLLGKMIRIDPRARNGKPYTVPKSNPFVGRRGRDEIFAYGFRNPFRWSFDFHADSPPRFAIGDVGQDAYEEVDYVRFGTAKGGNFGWNRCEGFADFNGSCPSSAIKPVLSLSHAAGNCSVIGGLVVRDPKVPALEGRYIFSDFCKSATRSFKPRFGRVGSTRATGISKPSITSYGESVSHRVFATSTDGSVYRLTQ